MNVILKELKSHSPFTGVGTITGIVLMAVVVVLNVPKEISHGAFWTLHPLHVLISAWVTAGLYYINTNRASLLKTIIVGYLGAVGIGTLSDCIIPYLGELLLSMPHAHHHIGFIEMWWLINPMAIAGAIIGIKLPFTKYPHSGHVLLSTWASLFHITMAMGSTFDAIELVLISAFLFLAVWLPCCVSDIVFPLLFVQSAANNK